MPRLAVVLLLVLSPAFVFAQGPAPQPRLITVTGEAEVRVRPDEVILTFGVETSNMDLEAARAQNDQLTGAVVAAAQRTGVTVERIQTDYLNIEPRYRDEYSQREFLGYFVRRTIAITLREPERFNELLSACLQAGANYVHGIDFRTTDLRNQRDYARTLAIRAAEEKAQDLAGELNQRIGQPYSIQEEPGGWYQPYSSWWGRGAAAMTQNVIQSVGGGAPLPEGGIALGEISVTARVTVSFELQSASSPAD